ncbi:WGR domain-containing protein [Nocardioides zeae]|uniref:DNA-binding WGR domain protein n=1 Tax=Nocardioides zeae TaxID=1457234 RepID=A0AAJ1X3Y4_9ACTN|nr:WGR domain-containing protein [Nocardioides zeae]MDQ1106194.1 putative DNA-binding WGR domain protein [Nocardioides zeae]
MEMRRFELVDGSADKFWSIGVEGARVVVHYGRNGTNGQVKEKTHGSAGDAAADAAKQVAAKVKKGYVEAGSGAAPASASTPATSAPAASAPAASTPATSAPAAPTVGPPAPAAATPTSPPEVDRDVPEPKAFEPGDLGFRWHPLELAALPEGPAAPAADPEGSPQDVVAACEAAAEAHVVADTSDYRRHEWVASPPFAGVPGELTARWWRTYMREHVPEVHENGRWRPVTSAEWQQARVEGRKLKEYGGHLDQRQRRARAAEVVLDAAAALPPGLTDLTGGVQFCNLDDVSAIAVDLVTDGRAAVLERVTSRVALEWAPALRALVPDLTAAEVDAALDRTRARWAEEGTPRFIDPDLQPALLRSVLLASPDEHADLVAGMTVGSDGYLSFAHLGRLVAAAVRLPDAESRRALWDRVVDASETDGLQVADTAPLPPALAIGLFGGPMFERAVAVVCLKGRAGEAVALAQRLAARVDGPGAVPGMLRLLARSKAGTVARDWLVAHRGLLAAYEGPLDRAEREALAGLVREILVVDPGFAPLHPAMVAVVEEVRRLAALPVLGADGAMPTWWTEAVAAEEAAEVVPSKIKVPKKLPVWTGALPPVRVTDGEDEARLDAVATAAVLGSAMRSALDPTLAPRPLVAAVRERMSASARDAVGSGLLRGFLGNGGASGERARCSWRRGSWGRRGTSRS